MLLLALLFAAGVWAGAQNALAGGGSFVTLPALILTGLDPKLANITSTVALFPGQVTTGMAGRTLVAGTARLAFGWLAAISLVGGVAGALLLRVTPVGVFGAMVPWLVLAATALFAWSSFGPKREGGRAPPPAWLSAILQGGIATYSGFFGGGAGIITLAALTLARMPLRNAGGTKNVLVAISNIAAALVFALTTAIPWAKAAAVGAGSMVGGYAGAVLLKRVPVTVLRVAVVVIGVALTIGLFIRR
ncbi:MAG: sulfite exporter TauE/SafE family protein [Sphingomonadaceae bacterium]|nr:sulfite exporter TauE/SafE family protein [Sphingomonadaceae bacterium]